MAKLYVDIALDVLPLGRNIQDNDFNNYNLTNTNSIALNTPAVNDNQVLTKTYIDHFHQENESSRRDLGIDFYDEPSHLVKNNQHIDFNGNKRTNINSISINRNPTIDEEVSNKKHIDDTTDEGTILRFHRTLVNYLKVSVGKDTYNRTKYNKIQITDTTIMKTSKTGGYLSQQWYI